MTGRIPLRTCIGCRKVVAKNKLVRLVLDKDGTPLVDCKGNMSGRGAYLCRNRECLDKAIKNHGLERSYHIRFSSEAIEKLIGDWTAQL